METDAEGIVEVYLPPETLKELDEWIKEQPMPFTRAEAIRAIVGATLGLMNGVKAEDEA